MSSLKTGTKGPETWMASKVGKYGCFEIVDGGCQKKYVRLLVSLFLSWVVGKLFS